MGQHGHVLTFQSASKAHQESDADVFSFTLTEAEMRMLDSLQARPLDMRPEQVAFSDVQADNARDIALLGASAAFICLVLLSVVRAVRVKQGRLGFTERADNS